MSRPRYETARDLAAESNAAGVIAAAWGVEVKKIPDSYGADWMIERDGSHVGWGEYKRRNMVWGQYPTVVLSVRKVVDLIRLADVAGRSLFFVEANDGIRYASVLAHDQFRITMGGRTCRTRDAADVEPVVQIPVDRFKPVVTK